MLAVLATRVTVAVLPLGKVVASPAVDVLASVTVDEEATAGVDVEVTLLLDSILGFTGGELSIVPIATAPLMSAN